MTERFVHQMVGVSADGNEAYVIITGIQRGDTFHPLEIEGINSVNLNTGTVELRVKHSLRFTGSFNFPITADQHVFIGDKSWDLNSGKMKGDYPWKPTDLARFPWQQVEAVEKNGRYAAFTEGETGLDMRVAIWDVKAKKRLGLLPRLAAGIGPMAFSPDGTILAVGGRRDWKSDRLPPERRQPEPPDTEGWRPHIRVGDTSMSRTVFC